MAEISTLYVFGRMQIPVRLDTMDSAVAVAWWRLVNADWVKQPAFAYAERLLEATAELAE